MIQDQLAACGLDGCRGAILIDGSPAVLTEKALKNHEGILTSKGALAVETGKYTGRSPEDRFIVDTPDVHDQIAGAASTSRSLRRTTRRSRRP